MPIWKSRFDTARIAQYLREPISWRVAIAILFALNLLKLLVVPTFYDFHRPVGEIGFRFGAATEAVIATGAMTACPPLFLQSANLKCASAERMPLIPYLYAGAMKLVGDSALRVAIFKTVILDLLLLYFLSRWFAIIGADRFTLALMAMVFAGPQYMLHSFSPAYEEGFLVQLLGILLLIQFVYVWQRENELARCARLPAYVAVNAAIYLVKSSMLLVVTWSFVFLVRFVRLRGSLKFVAVSAMCAPLLLWGSYTKYVSGRFAVGTSIDGWNLFLGNNSATLDFYPRYTVDLIRGDGPIQLEGRTFNQISRAELDRQLGEYAGSNEWQVNDGYRNLAIAWALGHVVEELRLVGRRLRVFFLEIRNTPFVPGYEKPTAVALVGVAWMAATRVVMWSAILAAVLAVWRGTNMRHTALCFLCLLAAYAAPCIVAYAYERHVVPIILPSALFLASVWRLRAPGRPPVWK